MQKLARNGFTVADLTVALHGPVRRQSFRYELLDRYGAKKADLATVLAGSVAHNALAAIKRTARFSLRDDPLIDFLSDRIKPYVRIYVPPGQAMLRYIGQIPGVSAADINPASPGGWAEFSQGVFLLSTPPRRTDGTGVVTREVEAYDLTQVLLDDKVLTRYTVPAGTNYITAVTDLLDSAALADQNLTPTGKTLPADVDWAPGTSKFQIINELLRAINYRPLWFDEDGQATASPYVTPDQQTSEYTYRDDVGSVLFPEMEQSLDLFAIPNQWILTVSEPDRSPLTFTYTNNNPGSPTSTASRGRTIVAPPQQVNAVDLGALEGLAQRRAFEASQVYETVNLTTGLMPMHSHEDVYTLAYSKMGITARFTEVEWSMELRANATMKHKIRRIVTV